VNRTTVWPTTRAAQGAGGRVPGTRPPVRLSRGDTEKSISRHDSSRHDSSRHDSSKERKVSLLSIELARERIRERQQEVEEFHAIALARAYRRAHRDTRGRAFRVRRIPLTR
jgi:hypothetical protein